MPIATRTFRVFVSSTFEDLKTERDALQREVFPKLRKLCEQSGARFQAIDLRWGVRDEAALDQQTMEICLREIQRCKATGVKPNFIVLLGERYGWQPLPPRIPAFEFDRLRPSIRPTDAQALAERWYRLDQNADPPEYRLQPRTGAAVDPTAWSDIEQNLRTALAEASQSAGLSAPDRIKYEASATHQEILAGLGETQSEREHVFGFFRRNQGTIDPPLKALQEHLHSCLPGNIRTFDKDDITELCNDVYARLSAVIEREIKQFIDRPALDLEIEAHDHFAAERSRIFTGRHAVLDSIAAYIEGPERRPLVLHGASGAGKSAVMARASQTYRGPARVIRRFIGVSPETASGAALLTSLCRQIAPGSEPPVDYPQLERTLREHLAAIDQPTLLFIDALDQLDAREPARLLNWLPREFPPALKVIVSTTDERASLPAGLPLPLEGLEREAAGVALGEWLAEAGRTLQRWQRDKLLAHFERSGLPLYLKLAAEEARLWPSYAPDAACVLGEGVAGMIDTLFDRLQANTNHGPVLVDHSLGYLAAARYGLTENEMLDVLTADDVVWQDFDARKHHDVSARRLPVVVWSRLSLDLEPYLTERRAPGGTVTGFYHRQVAELAAERFLQGEDRTARHVGLARYFGLQPIWLDEVLRQGNPRRAVEMVVQQVAAGQWAEAEATLLDVRALFAKCMLGLVRDIDDDFRLVLRDAPKEALPLRRALDLVQRTLRLVVNILVQSPEELPAQLVGRLAPDDTEGLLDCLVVAQEVVPSGGLILIRPTLTPPGSELRRFEGHTAAVNSIAVLPDGRLVSGSDDHTLRLWDAETGAELRRFEGHTDPVASVAGLPDGRIVSGSHDHTLRLWDVETGAELRRFEGHTDWVTSVAVLSDGRLVSGSYDCTLRLWDIENGAELRRFEGHTDVVNSVAVLPDGRIVSGSRDKTLRLSDVSAGTELRRFEGHTDWVTSVAVLPDGRIISGSRDKTLRLWDVSIADALRRFEGHTDWVTSVAVMPDGEVVSGSAYNMFLGQDSADRTLRLWNVAAGTELRRFEGHADGVSSIAALPDGRIVSASYDQTLRLWDIVSSTELRRFEGHTEQVSAIATFSEGRIVSSSLDKTLRLWNVVSGTELRRFEGHTAAVKSVTGLTNNKIVSGSLDKLRRLCIWDAEAGTELARFEGHTSGVSSVAVLHDEVFISSSFDATVRIWDAATGAELTRLEGHTSGVNAVAALPGGLIVSGSSDNTLRLWDVERGNELHCFEGHRWAVTSIAVFQDIWIISGSGDNTVRLWDVQSGLELRRFEGHTKDVTSVAILPDGSLVSGAHDKTLRVWEIASGTELTRLTTDVSITALATTPDNLITAGDELGRIHVLRIAS